jgi:hypothetical protein
MNLNNTPNWAILAGLFAFMMIYGGFMIHQFPDKPKPAPTPAQLAHQAAVDVAAQAKIAAETHKAECGNIDLFYEVLKKQVKRNLRAPSTAKFAGLDDEGVKLKKLVDTPDGSCSFFILSYVDAENSFGAHIRTRFIGKVILNSEGDFHIENFAFGG